MNPFNRQSAHHLPIGSGARYAGDNDPATRDWLKASRFAINVGGPWGADVAATGSSDVVRQVNGRAFGPQTSVIGLPASIRLPRNGLITTIELNRSNNYDGVAVVHDRVAGTTHELYQYDWNNGNPLASIHRQYDIRGLGHGTSPGQRVGVTATGVSFKLGLLRGHQINTPGHRIEHALQMVLPMDRPNECNIMLGMDIIRPATTRDGHAGRSGNNSGNIRYGELLALPATVNLNSLGLSEPGMRLAQAIRNYGIRVVDGGGCGAGAIRADQHVSSQVMNQLWNDIPKIYRHIRVVTNGEWRPGLTAIGGGQPLARNCAFDASGNQQIASTPSSSQAASTPQGGQAGSTSANQNQQPSGGSTSSAGGMLSWPAIRNAQNYYLEIRAGSGRGERVFGRMVPPDTAGCPTGQGTCSFAVPSLAAGQQYVWNVRAVVGGQTQLPTAWQNVASSTGSDTSSTAQSSPPSVPQTGTSSSGTNNQTTGASGSLQWQAIRNAQNYYLEIRAGSGRGERVFGRMVPPDTAGCPTGQGTCSFAVPSLAAGQQYVWNVRAVVGGQTQLPTAWQNVASSTGSGTSSTAQSSPPSVPQTGSIARSTSDGALRWAATPRANNYYLEIRAGSGRGPIAFGRMVPPDTASCPTGQGTCSRDVPPLAAGEQHVWNVRAVVNGNVQSPTPWQPVN